VDHISFEGETGDVFAFLRPNGAGKMTTIKILSPLLTPTDGEVLVNGYNIMNQKNDV